MTPDEIKSLDPTRVIILDTETTGFSADGSDEILSLSIINLEGTVLFNELVKPAHRKRWPKAQEVNGITPAMVKDKLTLLDHADRLSEIWRNADLIVGYNTGFDMAFIRASGVGLPDGIEEFDVMREYASAHHLGTWVKLVNCAEHYGIGDFDAHSSIGDTEATRRCFLALLEDPAYKGKPAKKKPVRVSSSSTDSFYERVSAPHDAPVATQEASKPAKEAGGLSSLKSKVLGFISLVLLWLNAALALLCFIGDEPAVGLFFLVVASVLLAYRTIRKKRQAKGAQTPGQL